MANWLTYRIRVGDDVLVLADEEARELIKNETERSKKADAQTASFLESTTSNGIIRNGKSDPFGQTAVGGMKVVIDKGDLIIKGNIKNHTRLTRTYNVTQENRTEVFLYRYDSVTSEITGLWRDCIIQGDIILSREDKTELPLRSSGYYDILICKITIPAGATEITQDMIGDFRQNEYYCGYAKNLLVEIDETLTKSDAAADAAAVGTVISDLRKETRTRDIITEKRITNLEAGLPAERWSVDDSVAYTKDVPENALPFASVDMVGGMTYKDGDVLRSAPVTEVESVGANLIPFPYATTTTIDKGITYSNNGDGGVTVDGTATGVSYFCLYGGFAYKKTPIPSWLKAGETYITSTDNSSVHCLVVLYDVDGTSTTLTEKFVMPSGYDYCGIFLSTSTGSVMKDVTAYPVLTKGSTAHPYTPYRRNTLPIPAEVQALGGYGWGSSDKVYNYIDWGKKQFVKRVERVDMGALDYDILTNSNNIDFFQSRVYIPIASGGGDKTLICAEYVCRNNRNELDFDKTVATRNDGSNVPICVRDDSYTDAITFKAAMSGVMLYYELAEPVITDISDLLPDDNLIGVEGGGTVTMTNEYGYDVPSEITYQLKGAEA